jgi:putative SOS response-associated peptidase YedK
MCYNSSLRRQKTELEEYYNRVAGEDINFLPYYSVSGFSHPDWPLILSEAPDKFCNAKWGFIPSWTKTKEDALKFRDNCLNAKGETVFHLPSFRNAIRKRRCLVPVTGFYEWMDYNKNKYPHHIAVKDVPFFSLAGIYEDWIDKETGEIVKTFAIVTTEANPLMEKIHNIKRRMPLILSREKEAIWLNESTTEAELKELIKPFDEHKMSAYTISKRITSRKDNPNAPETLEPHEYPELALMS